MSPERPSLSNDGGGPTIFDAGMVPLASATTTILSHFPIDASTASIPTSANLESVVNSPTGGISNNSNHHPHHFILQQQQQQNHHGNTITVNQNHIGSHSSSPSHHFSASSNNNNSHTSTTSINGDSSSSGCGALGGGSAIIESNCINSSSSGIISNGVLSQSHLSGCQIYSQVPSTPPAIGTVTTVLQSVPNGNNIIYSVSNGMTALTSLSSASAGSTPSPNTMPASSKLLILQQPPQLHPARSSPQPPQTLVHHIENYNSGKAGLSARFD